MGSSRIAIFLRQSDRILYSVAFIRSKYFNSTHYSQSPGGTEVTYATRKCYIGLLRRGYVSHHTEECVTSQFKRMSVKEANATFVNSDKRQIQSKMQAKMKFPEFRFYKARRRNTRLCATLSATKFQLV